MALSKPRHDPFFSRSLEHSPLARDFFSKHIPLHLREHLGFDHLIRVDRNNTDARLKRRQRDIIYKMPLKQTRTAFLCAEHQSQEQLHIPLRVLRYYTDSVEMYLKAGNRKWPLVVSVIFYHGEKSPYPYSSEVYDYYEDPILGSEQLSFRFYVIDITQISDEEILTYGPCAPMEVLLKHGRDGNFELEPSVYSDVFHACIAAVGEEYIFSMLAYATERKDLAVGKRIYNFIEQVLKDKQELIMTYGQQLRQEGIQQTAKQMLRDGVAIEKIVKWTGLRKAELAKLRPS